MSEQTLQQRDTLDTAVRERPVDGEGPSRPNNMLANLGLVLGVIGFMMAVIVAISMLVR